MLIETLVEFIGTFVFLSIVLIASKTFAPAIVIGLGLIGVILFGGNISGGHFNPAISSMFYMKGDLDCNTLIMYVLAQLLGGYTALKFYQIHD